MVIRNDEQRKAMFAKMNQPRTELPQQSGHLTVRQSCQASFSRKIRKNIRENPNRPRQQNIAVSASQVRKARPECKRVLRVRGR